VRKLRSCLWLGALLLPILVGSSGCGSGSSTKSTDTHSYEELKELQKKKMMRDKQDALEAKQKAESGGPTAPGVQGRRKSD
jgi:hypothetical protein